MTLQQTIQPSADKTRELFDKLEKTTDGAVKTRENLFVELSREIRLHSDIERRAVIPALRGTQGTKTLVSDAEKTNKQLRAKLNELEALAKDDDAFLPGLAELRKLFQQQLRDERKELATIEGRLPEEQADAVVRKIEDRLARAEDDQRAEAEREREHARAQAARKRAAEEVAEAAKRTVSELGKSAAQAVKHGTEAVRESSEDAATSVATAIERVRDGARERAVLYRQTARERGEDVKAVGAALRNFAQVGAELRTVMVNSLKRSGRDSLETTRQLLRNPRKMGQVQRDYAAAATRNLMESTSEMMQVIRSASAAAQQPVEQRIHGA